MPEDPKSTLLTPAEVDARMKKLKEEGEKELEVRTLVLDGFRRPENANLRLAVSLAQEDAHEEIAKALHLAPGAGQAAIDFGGIAQIIAVLGPLLASIFKKEPPKDAPVPKPEPAPALPPGVPPGLVAPPPSGPKPVEVAVHRIVGGRAHLTGITEGGPLGHRVDRERMKQIMAGEANAPHDSRFEFDFTPIFEDGHVGQPSGPGEPGDPYFLGVEPAPKAKGDTDGPMQAVRLRWDVIEGTPVRNDLSREYAANGCTPRARISTDRENGVVVGNFRFEYAGGATPVEGVDEIFVGRGAGR